MVQLNLEGGDLCDTEWLPLGSVDFAQADFRLKTAVREFKRTALDTDLGAVFPYHPDYPDDPDVPEHVGRARVGYRGGGGGGGGPPPAPRPPPGFGPAWWEEVCGPGGPEGPAYPAASIRDALNPAAAGRWAGLGDPVRPASATAPPRAPPTAATTVAAAR